MPIVETRRATSLLFFLELLRKKSYKINFKIVQKSFW